MSKPKSLEYRLKKWTIAYSPNGFDVGEIGPDYVDWNAVIIWKLDVENKTGIEAKDVIESKSFRTYNDARAWVEEHTGLKFQGFSDE